MRHRNVSYISFNSTQEVDTNSSSSYIEKSPFNKKRRDMLFASVESIEYDEVDMKIDSSYIEHKRFNKKRCDMLFASEESIERKGIEHSEIAQKKRTMHQRNTRDISFNSTQEVDKNSASSYIEHSTLKKKRRNMFFTSVESIEYDG
ncbi:hypothetical protein STEG23_038233 [Scotinomys teguina]